MVQNYFVSIYDEIGMVLEIFKCYRMGPITNVMILGEIQENGPMKRKKLIVPSTSVLVRMIHVFTFNQYIKYVACLYFQPDIYSGQYVIEEVKIERAHKTSRKESLNHYFVTLIDHIQKNVRL